MLDMPIKRFVLLYDLFLLTRSFRFIVSINLVFSKVPPINAHSTPWPLKTLRRVVRSGPVCVYIL